MRILLLSLLITSSLMAADKENIRPQCQLVRSEEIPDMSVVIPTRTSSAGEPHTPPRRHSERQPHSACTDNVYRPKRMRRHARIHFAPVVIESPDPEETYYSPSLFYTPRQLFAPEEDRIEKESASTRSDSQ